MPTATRRRLLGLWVVIGLLAGIMAVAPVASATIVLGQGIDGIKLGDTQAQVQQKLGPPAYTDPPAANGSNSDWGYPTTFEGRVGFDSALHVNGMWTISKQQKTSKGIGPGSSLAQVRKAYPKAKCSSGPLGPGSLVCALKSSHNRLTVETSFTFPSRTTGAEEVDIDLLEKHTQ